MRKNINRFLSGLLLLLGGLPVVAETISDIDSYGIYIAAEKGYVKIKPFSHDYRFADFNYLNEIASVKRQSDELKLVVYEKEFHPSSLELELRTLDVIVNIQKLEFNVKPMDKADMYELNMDSPVKNGAMLQVRSWTLFDNMGIIMLGDTEEELVKYFSNKQLPKATVVTQYLDDALVAFPANSKLKELGDYWKKAARAEKDKEAYAYVEEKWQQYEKAEKLSLKERYLNMALGEINGYLNDHPNGYKADEAKQRQAIAIEKLKEYEKLL